jgi:hypothetical protein
MCCGIDCNASTQLEQKQLFACAFAELGRITLPILIVKAMLPFDVDEWVWFKFECWIAINVWDDTDFSVGAFLEQFTHWSCMQASFIHL